MSLIGWKELIKNYMTKFAIGCLVQWYECDIINEYIDTLKRAIDSYEGEVIVDITICVNQQLEKAENSEILRECIRKINDSCSPFKLNFEYGIYTIADYRREFNDKFCTQADVLVWGESDMLVPSQMFIVLNHLHQQSQSTKYIAFFGICKMWDDSWKALEHPDFTDKPFIENDYDNWWSLKYTMTAKEMEDINSKTIQPQVSVLPTHKFNGCGLVISSEVIKAGVNIPQSVFFVHEDTAFMLMIQKVLGNIPQYVINNILVVHNRNHPNKRKYIEGESGDTLNQKRRSNNWYVKANKYSEENCYNIFNPNHKSKTWIDVWK